MKDDLVIEKLKKSGWIGCKRGDIGILQFSRKGYLLTGYDTASGWHLVVCREKEAHSLFARECKIIVDESEWYLVGMSTGPADDLERIGEEIVAVMKEE